MTLIYQYTIKTVVCENFVADFRKKSVLLSELSWKDLDSFHIFIAETAAFFCSYGLI